MISALKHFRFVVVVLAATAATQVYAATLKSVQDKSELEFIANYEGADAPGRFDRFEVDMGVDPASLAPSSLQVKVDIKSVSMGNTDIDEAIAEAEWFDAQAFPQALFRSNKISETDDREYAAEGVVSIKGMDQPITVPFHWQAEKQGAVMTGHLKLSRLDFGIGSGEWASDSSIGHDVRVRFSITLKSE